MSLQSSIHPSDFASDGNLMAKIFQKLLGEACFIEIVQVQSIEGKTCTIKPLLAKRDPSGAKIPTTAVSGIPFFRLQMGTSAIKMPPKQGDIGLLLCCDRDITNILATKAESVVASGFTHSKKDGIYLGGIELLNADPTEYIEFTGSGINVVSPGNVTINGVTIQPDGTMISKDGIIFDTHIHSQGADSSGDTEQDTGTMHN